MSTKSSSGNAFEDSAQNLPPVIKTEKVDEEYNTALTFHTASSSAASDSSTLEQQDHIGHMRDVTERHLQVSNKKQQKQHQTVVSKNTVPTASLSNIRTGSTPRRIMPRTSTVSNSLTASPQVVKAAARPKPRPKIRKVVKLNSSNSNIELPKDLQKMTKTFLDCHNHVKLPPPVSSLGAPDQLETPFSCTYCRESFVFPSSLQLHLSRKTCRICFYCRGCCTFVTVHNKCMLSSHLQCFSSIDTLVAWNVTVKPPDEDSSYLNSDEVLKQSLSNLMSFDITKPGTNNLILSVNNSNSPGSDTVSPISNPKPPISMSVPLVGVSGLRTIKPKTSASELGPGDSKLKSPANNPNPLVCESVPPLSSPVTAASKAEPPASNNSKGKEIAKNSLTGWIVSSNQPSNKTYKIVPATGSLMEQSSIKQRTECETVTQSGKLTEGFVCKMCKSNFADRKGLANHFAPSGSVAAHYVCDYQYCQFKVLPTLCALKAHKILHTQQAPFVCPECGEEIVGTFEIFMKHVHKKCLHHSRKLYFICNHCSIVKQQQGPLVDHVMASHTEKFYKCPMCPLAFKASDQAGCVKHISSMHSGVIDENWRPLIVYKCLLCAVPTVLVNKDLYQKHVTAHIQNQMSQFRFLCQICHTCHFREKRELKQHLQEDHSVTPIAEMCSFCGTEHSSRQNLEEHLEASHPNRTSSLTVQKKSSQVKTIFKCPKCMFVFMTKPEVIYHLQTVHPLGSQGVTGVTVSAGVSPPVGKLKTSSIRPWPSPDKVSSPPAKSNGPITTSPSEEDKRYGCPVCLRRFNNQQWFKRHLSKHEDDEIYVCRYCCIVYFAEFSDLAEHQIMCKWQRRRNLNQMKKRLSSSSATGAASETPLKDDTEDTRPGSDDRAGDGEQLADENLYRVETYDCEQCDQVFESWDSLRQHLKTDHGITPHFSCQLCGLTYVNTEELREHTQRVHEGKGQAYRCYLCHEAGKTMLFDRRFNLERHMVSAHKVQKFNIEEDKVEKVNVTLGSPKDVAGDGDKKQSGLDRCVKNDSPPQSVRKLRVEGETVFSCAKCDFTCDNRTRFKEHIVIHRTEEEAIQCLECGTCFRVQPALKKHLFIVHKVKNLDKYYQEVGVNYDVVVETNVLLPGVAAASKRPKQIDSDNPYECQVCYRSFTDETGLRQHMRTHGVAFIRSKRRLATEKLGLSRSKIPHLDDGKPSNTFRAASEESIECNADEFVDVGGPGSKTNTSTSVDQNPSKLSGESGKIQNSVIDCETVGRQNSSLAEGENHVSCVKGHDDSVSCEVSVERKEVDDNSPLAESKKSRGPDASGHDSFGETSLNGTPSKNDADLIGDHTDIDEDCSLNFGVMTKVKKEVEVCEGVSKASHDEDVSNVGLLTETM